MRTVLSSVPLIFLCFGAFADNSFSDSSKRFNCLSWYRDTLSISIKSAQDISVSNQFDYQVKYTPSVWSRTDIAGTDDFNLSNTISVVSKHWDGEQKDWKYTALPDTKISIEFKNNEPMKVTSSFGNRSCQLDN